MTKIALPDGRVFKIPSRARVGKAGIVSISGTEGVNVGMYETGGLEYTVGDHVEGEGTRFEDYPFSPLNRVVVHHLLRLMGLSGKQVKIGTGLPVATYFSGPSWAPAHQIIERKNASLLTEVRATSGDPCASISSSHVFAEGVAAWIDHSVDVAGNVVVSPTEPAAVVDIGGRTTDIVTILPGWRVDSKRSGTANIGVLDLMEAIRNEVNRKFETEVAWNRFDHSLVTNRVKLWNQEQDIKEIVAASKQQVLGQIAREIQRQIGKGVDFETILFVGGGAKVFEDVQKNYRNAVMATDPDFANARGILKYMQHVM